jgi:hypothetical protein
LVALPGFVGIAPGNGEIMIAPVSVCHHVSTMVVDYQTMAAGMLFTLVMGRLGGLVPALSAMRMEILDSLK